jgi:hypothetical protein
MFHDKFCVGRFRMFPDVSNQAMLRRPARKWLEPVVEKPLMSIDLASIFAGSTGDAPLLTWLSEQGLDFDTDGFFVFSVQCLTPQGKTFVAELCRQLSCDVIDCLGRICTSQFRDPIP